MDLDLSILHLDKVSIIKLDQHQGPIAECKWLNRFIKLEFNRVNELHKAILKNSSALKATFRPD